MVSFRFSKFVGGRVIFDYSRGFLVCSFFLFFGVGRLGVLCRDFFRYFRVGRVNIYFFGFLDLVVASF